MALQPATTTGPTWHQTKRASSSYARVSSHSTDAGRCSSGAPLLAMLPPSHHTHPWAVGPPTGCMVIRLLMRSPAQDGLCSAKRERQDHDGGNEAAMGSATACGAQLSRIIEGGEGGGVGAFTAAMMESSFACMLFTSPLSAMIISICCSARWMLPVSPRAFILALSSATTSPTVSSSQPHFGLMPSGFMLLATEVQQPHEVFLSTEPSSPYGMRLLLVEQMFFCVNTASCGQ